MIVWTPSLVSLAAIAATLACFAAADTVHKRTNGHPLTHPVLVSIIAIGGTLMVVGIPYDAYFEGAGLIHFLLGPATVALAVPLYRNLSAIRSGATPLGLGLVLGSVTAMAGAAGLAALARAPGDVIAALIPKSVTAPVAMELAPSLGGAASLTAALVIATGTLGAAFGPWILRRLSITDERAAGFALGVASHGIGTAQAFRISPKAGAFASLGMGLNAILTSGFVALLVLID